jgi:Nif-specific regulatory protein
LIAIAGPLEGQVFSLVVELAIGRERSNTLAIEDPAISRRHCLFRPQASDWLLRDLNSMNGTYVNGLPVQERLLEDGDQIQIGRTLFAFSAREPSRGGMAPDLFEIDQRGLTTGATMTLRVGDSVWQAEKLIESLPQVWRNARHLELLLKLGAAIPVTASVEALERTLLELIFEAVPAQRGAILLCSLDSSGLEPHFHLVRGQSARSGEGVSVMRVPQQAVQNVLRDGMAMVSNNVMQDGIAADAGDRIRALAAVPLTAIERPLGVLYLDSADPDAKFDDEDLQLLTGVAGIAAAALDRAMRVESLERDNLRLQAEVNLRHSMVGESPAMLAVYRFISKVAPSNSTVLICGESGTGKELIARAIHRNSTRAGKPFVAINCAAVTETLLESEFFGHEKGAFTGAVAQRKGKLEEAEGGTVFLDEVGELAPSLQAKLLRVVQEREFQRVGGNRTIRADIRVVAATNRDLEEAVRRGTFRQDLFYRLNVVSILMPPLRERKQDIALLAHHFAQKHSSHANRTIAGISAAAREALTAYDWPGNVRELENAIERGVVLGSTEEILPEDLPDSIVESASAPMAATRFHEAVLEAKRRIVLGALEKAGGNYTEAARTLGLHPSNLHRLIRTLGLR